MEDKSIHTQNLILEVPKNDDFNALRIFEERNQLHLSKWQSKRVLKDENDYLTSFNYWREDMDEGNSIRFFIKPKDNPQQIIGMCNFTQIYRGAFQACYLGYNLDYEFEGRGYMFEALQSGIKVIFEELQLHRIMANYMPINKRSANLLQRLGFIVEGYARDYLLINNCWEDHVLTALSQNKWRNDQTRLQAAL